MQMVSQWCHTEGETVSPALFHVCETRSNTITLAAATIVKNENAKAKHTAYNYI